LEVEGELIAFLQITDSLVTFGIAEDSANLVVAVFDDPKGDKLAAVAKKIKGRAVALDQLKNFTNYDLVKKVSCCLFSLTIDAVSSFLRVSAFEKIQQYFFQRYVYDIPPLHRWIFHARQT
jgi:hypothetical protein